MLFRSTSLLTSSVTLLTSPESKVGVWVDRIQINGLLIGSGDDYPHLILYSKSADIKVGDFISSSPASTLFPPNIPIGIVQSVKESLKAQKTAKILLLAKPHLIDWIIPIGIFGGNNVLAGEDDTKSPTLISASLE